MLWNKCAIVLLSLILIATSVSAAQMPIHLPVPSTVHTSTAALQQSQRQQHSQVDQPGSPCHGRTAADQLMALDAAATSNDAASYCCSDDCHACSLTSAYHRTNALAKPLTSSTEAIRSASEAPMAMAQAIYHPPNFV